MKRASTIAYLALLVAAPVGAEEQTANRLSPTSSQTPKLELVDPDSEAFRQAQNAEFQKARNAAIADKRQITRMFSVGWDMHYGYYLVPLDKPGTLISPDISDDNVRDSFDAAMREDVLAAHNGEKLLCRCMGINWDYYGTERFVVLATNFEWVN